MHSSLDSGHDARKSRGMCHKSRCPQNTDRKEREGNQHMTTNPSLNGYVVSERARRTEIRVQIPSAHSNPIKRALYHMRCGKHSGFPLCCRLFFTLLWSPSYRSKGIIYRWWRCTGWRVGWWYVPCPICFYRGNRVKPKRCNCSEVNNANK